MRQAGSETGETVPAQPDPARRTVHRESKSDIARSGLGRSTRVVAPPEKGMPKGARLDLYTLPGAKSCTPRGATLLSEGAIDSAPRSVRLPPRPEPPAHLQSSDESRN